MVSEAILLGLNVAQADGTARPSNGTWTVMASTPIGRTQEIFLSKFRVHTS